MPSLIDLVRKNQYMSTLDTSRNVKPEKPKGHLVHTPLYKVPFEYFGDLARDTYGVAKGLKGKANDHELGKQNDLALRLGGLAIATYLYTIRPSRVSKLMEFVGLGSFFASLSLWPKLAIALPLKLRTGVDIQQKYVDSYGRKKKFFQDPQYLPWDLYSNEQIQKMGKKMGVPMDVPNRDEVIKEKARKLAVQGNTLWLTTAGFATPIMTGLICKGFEPVVENLKMKVDMRRADKILEGQVPLPSTKGYEKAFDSYLTANIGKRFRVSQQLVSAFDWSPIFSPNMPEALRTDLAKILENVPNDIDESYVDRLFSKLGRYFNMAGIKKEEVIDAFKKNGVFGSQKGLYSRYKAYNPQGDGMGLINVTSEIINKLLATRTISKNDAEIINTGFCINNIKNVVDEHNLRILDEKTAAHLKRAFHELSTYYSKEGLLRRWEDTFYTSNPDSLTTYNWKKVSKQILSLLHLTPDELKVLYEQRSKSAEIVEAKMNEIVADPKRYKEFISKVSRIIAQYDSVYTEARRTKYRNYVNAMCQTAKKRLSELGFEATARYIGGGEFLRDAAGNIIRDAEGVPVNYRAAMDGSLQNLRHILYDEKTLSQRASMYRFIQALDLKKRMQKPAEGKSYFEKLFDLVMPKDTPWSLRAKYSTVEEKARTAIMKAGCGDHACKLGGKAKNSYKAAMRLLYGAFPEQVVNNAIYKISGKSEAVATALEKGLEEGYRAALNSGADKIKLDMVRTGFTSDTLILLNEASNSINSRLKLKGSERIDLVKNFKVYFQTFIDRVVNADSELVKGFDLAEHNVRGAMKGLPSRMSPSLHQSLIGATPTKLVQSAAKQVYPDTKWLKRFGIAGAVILAGTLIATTFFGHIPEKEMYMRDSKNDGKGKKVI